MRVVVIRAEADAAAVESLAHKLPSLQFLALDLAAARRVVFGDFVHVVAVWSQSAAEQGMGAYLTANLAALRGRLAIATADASPMPQLALGSQRVAVLDLVNSNDAEFAAAWQAFSGQNRPAPVAHMRAESRRQLSVGDFAPGVSLGVAIFAGMFAAATAASREDIAIAVETGTAPVAVANALRPFLDDSVLTASAEVERIDVFTPRASFAETQRVAFTETQASDVLPIVAAANAAGGVVSIESVRLPQTVSLTPVAMTSEPLAPVLVSSVEPLEFDSAGAGLVPIDATIDVAANSSF